MRILRVILTFTALAAGPVSSFHPQGKRGKYTISSCSKRQGPRPMTLHAKANKKAKKLGTPSKPHTSGFGSGSGVGGAGGSAGGKATLKDALAQRRKQLTLNPYVAKSWTEYGALLMKVGEYAEAERAFQLGTERCPMSEMLSAALMTLQGHSKIYYHGQDIDYDPQDPGNQYTGVSFQSFSVPAQPTNWEPDPDRHDRQLDRSKGAGLVFKSTAPVLPPEECAWAIRIAEDFAASNGGWQSDRHASAPTTDMGIKDVPELLKWFNLRLKTHLFPMLASRFPKDIPSPEAIRVHDAFIVKYDEHGQKSLAKHQDESTFSFTIALNDKSEYEGGGTHFDLIRPDDGSEGEEFKPMAINVDAGGVVCFGGKLLHGGNAITSGTRYIIPLFVYVDANASGKAPGYAVRALQDG